MNAAWSLQSTLLAAARGWNAFFHQPCDARICAAIRIVYASLVLIHLAVLYPDLDLWFTADGLLPLEQSRDAASPYTWTLLSFLPDTSAAVHGAFWLTVFHAVALLVGFLPRLNAFFLFVWILSFQVRNTIIHDGEDALFRILGFFIIWLPSGRCWSINSLIARWWRSKPANGLAPGWPLRLLQVQMAALLFSSGLVKLSGDAWLGGTALYYVSRLDDHFGRFFVPGWVFDTPLVVALLTWSVLAIELLVPLLIWFRETRRPCLIVLLVFHLANEWTMNLFLFHWLMLCGWMSFVTPDEFSWLRKRSAGPQ